MIKIVCVGMITLDFLNVVRDYPKEDTENRILESALAIGGPIGRGALTSAKLGAETHAYGMIGTGVFADLLRHEFNTHDLFAHFIVDQQQHPSQHSFILISGSGKYRTTFWTPHPHSSSELLEISKNQISSADAVLIDCTERNTPLQIAQTASALGIPTVIDTGSYKPFSEDILPYVDHIVSPEKFFEKRAVGFDETPLEHMTTVKNRFDAKSVVMTRGEKGGFYLTPDFDEPRPYSALPVYAVDTCGAGDTFHGAYAFGIAKGWDIETTVNFSSWVAARKCETLGNDGIPTGKDIAAWKSMYNSR